MRDLRHRGLWIGLGIVMVAAVTVLSLVPPPEEMPVSWWDKVSHFVAYFVLVLWFSSIYAQRGTHHLLAAGFIGLGVVLEFAQMMTGYRMLEVTDMAANGAGATAAWALSRTRATEGLMWIETRMGVRR